MRQADDSGCSDDDVGADSGDDDGDSVFSDVFVDTDSGGDDDDK